MTRNGFYQGMAQLQTEAVPYEDYEIDGSDLEVVDPEKALAVVSKQVISMQEKFATGQLTRKEVDVWLPKTAENVRDMFRSFIEQIREQHPLYTSAVQDWALNELKRRQAESGYTEPESVHLELIDVLETVSKGLVRDREDPELIRIVELWREEECAAQCASDAYDLVQQAA